MAYQCRVADLMLVIFIHAVKGEVCIVILVHAERLHCVASIAPGAFDNYC